MEIKSIAYPRIVAEGTALCSHTCTCQRHLLYLTSFNQFCFRTMSNISGFNVTAGDEEGVQIPVYRIAIMVVCFEFTTNFLVILLLSTRQILRKKRYTMLVMSLGVADFVSAIAGVVWLVSQRLYGLGPQSAYICGTNIYLLSLGMFMSLYFTFVISLQRYLTTINSTWENKIFGYGRKYFLMLIPSLIIALSNPMFAMNWNREIPVCKIETMVGSDLFAFSTYISV